MIGFEVGQDVRDSPEDMTWRIVKLEDGVVGLSGPGPCRSYEEITQEELVANWSIVHHAGFDHPVANEGDARNASSRGGTGQTRQLCSAD